MCRPTTPVVFKTYSDSGEYTYRLMIGRIFFGRGGRRRCTDHMLRLCCDEIVVAQQSILSDETADLCVCVCVYNILAFVFIASSRRYVSGTRRAIFRQLCALAWFGFRFRRRMSLYVARLHACLLACWNPKVVDA